MFSTIAGLIALVALFAAVAFGYGVSRRFVRDKLRFVDAAQKRSAPLVAALGAWVFGSLAALLLPFVGGFAALSFGLAVGFGVAAGQRDVRLGAVGSRWLTDGR